MSIVNVKKNNAPPTPYEADEQKALMEWVGWASGRYPELKMAIHIPNGEFRPIKTGRKLKAMGVKSGVPDMMIPAPRRGFSGLFIELKRIGSGKLSADQKWWIERLQEQGYRAVVCFGWEDARQVIGVDVESEDIYGGEGLPTDPMEPVTAPPENFQPENSGTGSIVTADQASVSSSRADADNNVTGVGVLVLKDGRVLAGERSGEGTICGPSGHIEPGETPAQAGIRETQEEFGITPTSLKLLGQVEGLGERYGKPYVYLCTEYEGVPTCSSEEMSDPVWMDPDKMPDNMFPPFAESLKLLNNQDVTDDNTLTQYDKNGIIIYENNDAEEEKWITVKGTPIKIEDGELTGPVGDKIVESGESKEESPGEIKTVESEGKIERFKPTPENTKEFKFDWSQVAKEPGVEVDAIMVNGKPAALIGTRLSDWDKKNANAVYVKNLERAGADNEGKGGENKGAGKKLIAHAVNKAVAGGVDALYLDPATTAISYYQKLGFKRMGLYMILVGKEFDKYKE